MGHGGQSLSMLRVVRATFTLALSSAGCNRSGPTAEGTCSLLPETNRGQYSGKVPRPRNNDGRSELTEICQPNTFDLIRVGENRMNKVEEEVTC